MWRGEAKVYYRPWRPLLGNPIIKEIIIIIVHVLVFYILDSRYFDIIILYLFLKQIIVK